MNMDESRISFNNYLSFPNIFYIIFGGFLIFGGLWALFFKSPTDQVGFLLVPMGLALFYFITFRTLVVDRASGKITYTTMKIYSKKSEASELSGYKWLSFTPKSYQRRGVRNWSTMRFMQLDGQYKDFEDVITDEFDAKRAADFLGVELDSDSTTIVGLIKKALAPQSK